jgi:hypothetical protein
MTRLFFRPLLGCLVVLAVSLSHAGCAEATDSATPSTTSSAAPASATATPSLDPRLVGAWSSAGGAYAATHEYRAEGMSFQHVGGKTRGPSPYRIDGDAIIVTATMPSGRVVGETAPALALSTTR